MDQRLAIQQRADALFEAWCDRRCVRALRQLLEGYPLTSGLTDDWEGLRSALEGVRAFGRDELTDAESDEVEQLIAEIGLLLNRP